jgi:hypothetical protein
LIPDDVKMEVWEGVEEVNQDLGKRTPGFTEKNFLVGK